MKQKGFQFGTPIEICGKTYYIDVNRTPETAQHFQDVLKKLTDESDKEHNDFEYMKTIMDLAKELIDTAIGEGSFDDIFGGRRNDPVDLLRLIKYVSDEAQKAGDKVKREMQLAAKEAQKAREIRNARNTGKVK